MMSIMTMPFSLRHSLVLSLTTMIFVSYFGKMRKVAISRNKIMLEVRDIVNIAPTAGKTITASNGLSCNSMQ